MRCPARCDRSWCRAGDNVELCRVATLRERHRVHTGFVDRERFDRRELLRPRHPVTGHRVHNRFSEHRVAQRGVRCDRHRERLRGVHNPVRQNKVRRRTRPLHHIVHGRHIHGCVGVRGRSVDHRTQRHKPCCQQHAHDHTANKTSHQTHPLKVGYRLPHPTVPGKQPNRSDGSVHHKPGRILTLMPPGLTVMPGTRRPCSSTTKSPTTTMASRRSPSAFIANGSPSFGQTTVASVTC